MMFLIKRGKRAVRQQARCHLARFDAFGQVTGLAWCGRTGFDLSSNVGWGLRRCKPCQRAMDRAAAQR